MEEDFTDKDYEDEDEQDSLGRSLPVANPKPLVPVETKRFGKDSSIEELIEDDADQHTFILSMLQAGWKKVTNIDELCKMCKTHTDVLRERRKGLLKPTEAPTGEKGGNGRLPVWDG